MKNLLILLITSLFIASCGKNSDGNIAYRVDEKDLIPEGITYSSLTNSFYISSILKRKIVAIDALSGEYHDFVPTSSSGLRFLGIITDDKGEMLWACGNIRQNDETLSAVSGYSLLTGELLESYSFADSLAHTYNDLVQDNAGNIYFTDTNYQTVYKIDRQSGTVDIFYDGPEISCPNGITISPDSRFLYVASTDQGIRVLDIGSGTIAGEADTLFDTKGLDGLKYYHNSIIGLQNEVAETSDRKIARYFLDTTGLHITQMEIIDQDHPLFDIPTSFVIVNNRLYCLANSQMGNLTPDYGIRSMDALDDTYILKYLLR